MERLRVCGRFETPQFVDCGYSHMISIGDHDDFFDGLRLPEIPPENHLCLRFTDTEETAHPDAPTLVGVAPLFEWLGVASVSGLLVHCAAGISRSPAVALLSLCALVPEGAPSEHMNTVVASSECGYIWPNRLVVELGDSLLQTNGGILAALDDWRNAQDDQRIEFV